MHEFTLLSTDLLQTDNVRFNSTDKIVDSETQRICIYKFCMPRQIFSLWLVSFFFFLSGRQFFSLHWLVIWCSLAHQLVGHCSCCVIVLVNAFVTACFVHESLGFIDMHLVLFSQDSCSTTLYSSGDLTNAALSASVECSDD